MLASRKKDCVVKQAGLYEKICNLGIAHVIRGLNQYGSIWSVAHICETIQDKDESFKDFLVSLNTYGVYDMLVAICEIVNLFCSKDIQEWFYEQLSLCSDSEMVLRMADKFHQTQVTNLSKICNKFEEKPDIILSVNLPQFERFIWKNYDAAFFKKIGRNDSRNIGVWFPMIYDMPKIEKDIDKLEEYAFPYLLMCAKDIREGVSHNKVQEALVRMRIADYLAELGLLYYSDIEYVLDPLLDMDSKLVAEPDYNEYLQIVENILKKKLGHQLYITDTMTSYLSEMIHISEYFGDSLHRENIREMKVFIPLFYQMLGREGEAVELLIDTIHYFRESNIARKEYLLVFYRSLLITKDEKKRKQLISIFDEFYLNNSAVREFLTVAGHINIFYQKYCTDILERKKYLLAYQELSLRDKEYELFTRWFANKLVSKKFSSLLGIMTNNSGFRKSKAIDDYIKLFHSLTSHRDFSIRIIPYHGKEVLGDNYSWDSVDEIYDFYTEEEREQICVFAEQLEKAQNKMLAFDWQQYYNNIKQKAESFWNMDEDSILCSKLLTAFRGIQSDPYNKREYDTNGNALRKRAEDSINNLVAFFLRAYYGEENIHREEPQGLSGNENNLGEIDILIYHNRKQFAILEALKIDSLNKIKLDDHMNRLLNNYDTQGVPVTCLVIYAYTQHGQKFFTKIEEYLKEYIESNLFTYDVVKKLQKEAVGTSNICHCTMTYRREEMLQKMHVFTVLM